MKTVHNRTLKRSLLLALMLALSTPWALANPGDGRFQAREANRQNGLQRQQQPQYPRDVQRQDFQRNEGGEPQRPQRLSPEERRQLRRDIKDAGREIYPPRR